MLLARVKEALPKPVRKKFRKIVNFINREGPGEKDIRQKAVKNCQSLEEIRDACQGLNFTYFLDYDDQIETKQREFKAAIDHFKIDINGKAVLDVGPGTADSLDYARNNGASRTFFIEEEPVFVKFAEIKGHKGVMKNYTFEPYFLKPMIEKFDLIYTKGSINCTWVDEQYELLRAGDERGFFDFEKWVDDLKKLLKPGRGEIILMPAMGLQEERLIDAEYDLDTFYWCPDIDKYKASFFTKTLLKKGFECVENVEGFTQPKAFPLAFYYRN